MKLFCKHGVLYVNVNVILNIEKGAALKKLFGFINPLIPSILIERINTKTSEPIYQHLLCNIFDKGNSR